MATKTLPDVKPTKNARRAANSPLARATFGSVLPRPLPEKSIRRAEAHFANFSLSKFPKDSMPPNYVPHVKNAVAAQGIEHVRNFQRKKIEQHLHKLSKADNSNRGMKLSLPKETIKKFLPSYSEKAGTIDLNEVMKVITRNMNGTEFFTKGDPTLNRLALQAQAQRILRLMSSGEKK